MKRRRATYVANPRPDYLPIAVFVAASVVAAVAVALWVLHLGGLHL